MTKLPQPHAFWRGTWRLLGYCLLVVSPIILLLFMGVSEDSAARRLSLNLALIGLTILFLQPLLSGRLRWVSRPFGFDMVIRFHKAMAIVATTALLSHPFLLAYSQESASILYSLEVSWKIWLGRLAFLVLLATVFISIFQRRLGLRFEVWRLLHNVLGLVLLIAGFTHSFSIGHDLEKIPLQLLWILLFLTALLVYSIHKFLRYRLYSLSCEVKGVTKETEDVTTVVLTPSQAKEVYDFLPGQFHFIRFHSKQLPPEEHHFTISSSPADRSKITSTIKASGDFTQQVSSLKPGDQAEILGPYGRFSHLLHPEERNLLFIAGGIGVTPILSMLRYMRDTGTWKPTILIFQNRTEQDIVARRELAEMSDSTADFQVVHILSRPSSEWAGETGHVDEEVIRSRVSFDLKQTGCYISGPGKMKAEVIAALRRLGAIESQVYTERYRL